VARLDDRLLGPPQTAHEGTDGILRSPQVRDPISTYTKKIPLPFWAMCPSPLLCVVSIVVLRLVCAREHS
jgi:hypothetical protein